MVYHNIFGMFNICGVGRLDNRGSGLFEPYADAQGLGLRYGEFRVQGFGV